jgi:hypothetical protein
MRYKKIELQRILVIDLSQFACCVFATHLSLQWVQALKFKLQYKTRFVVITQKMHQESVFSHCKPGKILL